MASRDKMIGVLLDPTLLRRIKEEQARRQNNDMTPTEYSVSTIVRESLQKTLPQATRKLV